jgi:hypothetical protein
LKIYARNGCRIGPELLFLALQQQEPRSARNPVSSSLPPQC